MFMEKLDAMSYFYTYLGYTPVPLSVWQKQILEIEKNIGKVPVTANSYAKLVTEEPATEN